MRKLVTVRRISAIEPIVGADRIECVSIDGWKCVSTKGQFSVGDPCLYFEIDSFIPEGDVRFQFLMKEKIAWNDLIGARIRTREFRMQVSQGMAMPLAEFPEVLALVGTMSPESVRAQDFSEVVGVLKWERDIPAELLDAVHGAMPSYISKTDEERIQNIPEFLVEHADDIFEETIKLNGFSTTVFNHHGRAQSGVCMRNWWFKDDVPNPYTDIAKSQGLLDAVQRYPKSIALQGELVGPGICGNQDKLAEREFRLFRIINIDESRTFSYEERIAIVAELEALGVKILSAPTVRFVRLGDFGSMDDVLKAANGPSLNPDVACEGKVFRRLDGKCSFKVISNQFLLANADE
ncbi:MAG: RNA ligase family protein [Hafnia sp.]